MLRRSLFLFMMASGSVTPLFARNIVDPASSKIATLLKPTAAQKEAVNYISKYLLQNHYRKVSVNDSLSQEIFIRYINNLDGSKSYFMASDVERIRTMYGSKIDDEFLAGKATAGFDIYNLFLKRARQKMRYMRSAADTVRLDFSSQETLDLDRKSDPWPASR